MELRLDLVGAGRRIHHQAELVASEAARSAAPASRCKLELDANRPQDPVARLVPGAIVDRLEVIDIEADGPDSVIMGPS